MSTTDTHQQNSDQIKIADQIGRLSESGRAIALTLSCEEVYQSMNEDDLITLALEVTDKLAQINTLAKQL